MSLERMYVSVHSVTDSVGGVKPVSIRLKDGREYKIDQTTDYRPASTYQNGRMDDCYTVMIHGQRRYLFFERENGPQKSTLGRWFVETEKPW